MSDFAGWLIKQLDLSLMAHPTRAAKLRHLTDLDMVWHEKIVRWESTGGKSIARHPTFGAISLFEFNAVFCAIADRRAALMRDERVAA